MLFRAMPFGKTHHPGPIHCHLEPLPQQPKLVQRAFGQQRLDQAAFQGFQLLRRQAAHHLGHRSHVRQTHLEQFLVILAKLALLPIVIHGIARAFFEQKHRQAGRQQFRLLILRGLLLIILNRHSRGRLPHETPQHRQENSRKIVIFPSARNAHQERLLQDSLNRCCLLQKDCLNAGMNLKISEPKPRFYNRHYRK